MESLLENGTGRGTESNSSHEFRVYVIKTARLHWIETGVYECHVSCSWFGKSWRRVDVNLQHIESHDIISNTILNDVNSLAKHHQQRNVSRDLTL